jgi:Tol biopolymer transport system component
VSSKPYIFDIATRKVQPVAEFPTNAEAMSVAWAPDGKRIAYTWKQLHPALLILKGDRLLAGDLGIPTEWFLIVADANGRNAKTVCSAKCDNALNFVFGGMDWR